jgi:hypothetical protein
MMGPLLAILAAIAATTSPASASSCYSVRDYDRRQACLAEERRSPDGCISIRDWDDRERCRKRAGERDAFGRPTSDRWSRP